MQRIILYIGMAMLATCAKVTAQETKTFEQQAKEIATNIKTRNKREEEDITF